MRILFGFLSVVLFAAAASAQARFENIFGGTGTDIAFGTCTSPTGYFITGQTNSFEGGGNNIFLAKVALNGNIIFFKILSGAGNDIAYSVDCTQDGGCVITGESSSFGTGGADLIIVKFDSLGNLQWAREMGGNFYDGGDNVKQAPDGSIVVCSYTESYGAGQNDFFITKLDAAGNLLWSRVIGGPVWDEVWKVEHTYDGGHIFAGAGLSYVSGGASDIYIAKLDANGNLLWFKNYGTSGDEGMHSIIKGTSNSYYLAGNHGTGNGDSDFFLMKIDGQGNFNWARSYGGPGQENAESIMLLGFNQLVVEGNTPSGGLGGEDVLLISVDTMGNLLWSNAFGGPNQDSQYAINHGPAITPTNDGRFLYAGGSTSFGAGGRNLHVFKADANGQLDTCGTTAHPLIVTPFNLVTQNRNPNVISINTIQTVTFPITDYTFSLITDTVICPAQVNLCDTLDCNDNSVCTTDSCDAALGCIYTTIDCNDNDACTADTCNPVSGCSNTATTTTLTITASVARPGESEGAVRVTVSGGTPPFLYSLDNANFQPGNTFTGLAIGTYQVYVTDGNGCPGQGTFTVERAGCCNGN